MQLVPHPMLVHFPIALLMIYALLELARHPKVVRHAWWFPVKSSFLILGWLAGIPTVGSGLLLTVGATGEWPKLLATHKNFALATLICFGVLALAHMVKLSPKSPPSWVRAAEQVLQPRVAVPLALLGLACITVTGALGGAMVYGADMDPVVSFLYNLLIE